MMISLSGGIEKIVGKGENTRPVFTNHSLEHSLSYSPDFCLFLALFECNTTSDWLNHTV